MTLLSLGELEIFVIYSFCRILGQREACRGNSSLMRSNASGESDTSSNGASSGSIWTSALTTSITSIYFDSSTMDLYSERLKWSEGEKLFRIRWYGPSKPRGDMMWHSFSLWTIEGKMICNLFLLYRHVSSS